MYAVIISGGKQYRVKEGEFLHVAKIERETGASVEFEQVLLVGEGESVKVGAPLRARVQSSCSDRRSWPRR